jgi:hypothetical protein
MIYDPPITLLNPNTGQPFRCRETRIVSGAVWAARADMDALGRPTDDAAYEPDNPHWMVIAFEGDDHARDPLVETQAAAA